MKISDFNNLPVLIYDKQMNLQNNFTGGNLVYWESDTENEKTIKLTCVVKKENDVYNGGHFITFGSLLGLIKRFEYIDNSKTMMSFEVSTNEYMFNNKILINNVKNQSIRQLIKDYLNFGYKYNPMISQRVSFADFNDEDIDDFMINYEKHSEPQIKDFAEFIKENSKRVVDGSVLTYSFETKIVRDNGNKPVIKVLFKQDIPKQYSFDESAEFIVFNADFSETEEIANVFECISKNNISHRETLYVYENGDIGSSATEADKLKRFIKEIVLIDASSLSDLKTKALQEVEQKALLKFSHEIQFSISEKRFDNLNIKHNDKIIFTLKNGRKVISYVTGIMIDAKNTDYRITIGNSRNGLSDKIKKLQQQVK